MIERIIAYPGGEGNAWADAREYIVRCRDCKWCMAYWKGTYCDRFAHAIPTADLNGFCAWGERSC